MNYPYALLLGVIEGITEFLPISSTFHLLLANTLFQIPHSVFMDNYVVIIQSGALFSAVVLFGKRILLDRKLSKMLIISFIPTALIGLMLHNLIKTQLFPNTTLQIVVFIAVGMAFLATEYVLRNKNNTQTLSDISIRHAVLIGIFQSLALMPGVSRSGILLLAMFWMGYKRSESAQYSFMLGIPTIFAASIFDMIGLVQEYAIISDMMGYIAVGWICAFIVAYFSMMLLIRYLETRTLNIFGWYRIIVGTIALLALR